MYTADRKIHLMEKMLKTTNEATLLKIETILDKEPAKAKPKKASFKDFAGIWTKSEADKIERIIADSCEQINPDDWK
jgi:hypothetical protein